MAGILGACVSLAVFLSLWLQDWLLVLPIVLVVTLLAVAMAAHAFFTPFKETLQALSSGVASFKDHDYSVSIAPGRSDELGQLVAAYNDLAKSVREERFGLFQRELLLDTVIQSSAVAVLIAGPHGAIVYHNREAQELLGRAGSSDGAAHVVGGESGMLGKDLIAMAAGRAPDLAEALANGKDGLLSLEVGAEPEIYHLTSRQFALNARIHHLYLIKKMTREIARAEVETWKKVIRVMTHEMNNSLAPIRSLMASAQTITARGTGTEKLLDIYASIGNRASHLQSFIEEYARFARLPKPRPQPVVWEVFVAQIRRLVEFRLVGDLPLEPAAFDPVQMEQVLINLIKNAAESGSPPEEICLRVLQNAREVLIAVEDRGVGMAAEQLQLALLPFYSTKRSGTGLGLPLCREIIEAHGGSFKLFNREGGGMAATCKLPVGKA